MKHGETPEEKQYFRTTTSMLEYDGCLKEFLFLGGPRFPGV